MRAPSRGVAVTVVLVAGVVYIGLFTKVRWLWDSDAKARDVEAMQTAASERRAREARAFMRQNRERVARLCRENRLSEGWTLLDLGMTLRSLGENRAAREAFGSSVELCRAIGARDYEARGLLSLARLAADEDDGETAERLTCEALAVLRGMDDRRGICEALLQLGELRGPTDAEAARSALSESVEIAREMGDAGKETHGRTLLACLPGADTAAAPSAPAPNAGLPDALQFFHLRWKATRDRAHLTAARRALDELLAKNPPEARESMTQHVRLNREVLAACKEAGL